MFPLATAIRRSQSNGETQYGQSDYRRIIGWPSGKSTATDFATYTIDWQPGSVGWYVDGKLLKRNTRNQDIGGGRRFRVRQHPSNAMVHTEADELKRHILCFQIFLIVC
jgi:beta-glucanase (GH16 family)